MISVIFGLCIYLIIGIILSSIYLYIQKKDDLSDIQENSIFKASVSLIFNWLVWVLIVIFKK